MKILVIDDEIQIRKLLQLTLESEGHEVLLAVNGRDGLQKCLDQTPDVVLMDLGLPDLDGLKVLSDLRKTSQVPVLILTVRGEETIKIEALDKGADDYLTKPFSTPELSARIRAITRRRSSNSEALANEIYESGRLKVDMGAHRVWIDGTDVHLTKTEFSLLEVLIENRGRVLTHRSLLEKIWGHQVGTQVHYLRVYMNNLRKKIESDPARPEFVHTEPGVGYRFTDR